MASLITRNPGFGVFSLMVIGPCIPLLQIILFYIDNSRTPKLALCMALADGFLLVRQLIIVPFKSKNYLLGRAVLVGMV
jgi:hypothetical protein